MGYLSDLLNKGWDPGEQREHIITVCKPSVGTTPAAKKPFWKFW